jgi:hypothetical protein
MFYSCLLFNEWEHFRLLYVGIQYKSKLMMLYACKQGCLCIRLSNTFVTSVYLSNKGDACLIWIKTMLTFDRIKLKLLCPRWLPHNCHNGKFMLRKLTHKSQRGVHKLKRGGHESKKVRMVVRGRGGGGHTSGGGKQEW